MVNGVVWALSAITLFMGMVPTFTVDPDSEPPLVPADPLSTPFTVSYQSPWWPLTVHLGCRVLIASYANRQLVASTSIDGFAPPTTLRPGEGETVS